jgi:hypothetical protein
VTMTCDCGNKRHLSNRCFTRHGAGGRHRGSDIAGWRAREEQTTDDPSKWE